MPAHETMNGIPGLAHLLEVLRLFHFDTPFLEAPFLAIEEDLWPRGIDAYHGVVAFQHLLGNPLGSPTLEAQADLGDGLQS